jgi:putative transposase
MARKRRVEVEGGVAHVWARGNNLEAIFVDEADRRRYLAILGFVVLEMGWRCLAYCQMTNHVHLIIETPRANLGDGMRWVHGTYARTFNACHGRVNHLFGARYGSTPIEDDEHLWFAAAYVALNPVKGGICATPGEWEWSSYAATMGERKAPRWLDAARLLERFGGGAAYGRFVAEVARERGLGPEPQRLAA